MSKLLRIVTAPFRFLNKLVIGLANFLKALLIIAFSLILVAAVMFFLSAQFRDMVISYARQFVSSFVGW